MVVVSGYFDPIHVGHLEYLEMAKKLGDKLIVIVNNDEQAILKKGKPFMKGEERLKIVRALKCVDEAYLSIDHDRTVCRTLEELDRLEKVDIFANGGDVTKCAEEGVCNKLGIKLVYGLGGKIQSSSWLTKKN